MNADVPIAVAMLLWNEGTKGSTPACVVRPLGHDDYYQYDTMVGACFSDFRELDTRGQQLQLLIEAWHAVTFHAVPSKMVHQALLVVPEYRSMLANDCLPRQFAAERS